MSNTLNLLPHNERASKNVQEKFKEDNLAAVVHATGTGKNYITLDLILNNPDKKFLFLAPSIGIIEHIQNIIKYHNLNLNNVEFRTYQSLIKLSQEELKGLDIDYLILDEFHHVGAPIWGNRIKSIIDTHENLKVLGLSAYTVRNRGRENEKDLACPYTDEIFSGKVVSTYELSTAILDKVLPLPTYKTAYVDYSSALDKIKSAYSKLNPNHRMYNAIKGMIGSIEQKLAYAKNMEDLFKENIKKDGKYIYFCPVNRLDDDDKSIESIKNLVRTWIHNMGLTEDDYIFYESTDDMGSLGKKNRTNFYHDRDSKGNDTSKKLRIMFAINQYNEGIHAPNVDGVIMGRDTKSDIVFYEQLGRALSVSSNDSLVIDLAGNVDYINNLQEKLHSEAKERKTYRSSDIPKEEPETIEFNIELLNVDILNVIKECEARLGMSFYDNYELAKNYYKKYGNLLIPAHFCTFDGIINNPEGIQLGQWIRTIRKTYGLGKLSIDKINLLNDIGMVWENIDVEEVWLQNYELACAYYNFYGDLEVPVRFKTFDGINPADDGVALGTWIRTQRVAYSSKTAHKITPKKIELLDKIGMRWGKIDQLAVWKSKYKYAKKYFDENGSLEVPKDFICEGGFNLFVWLKNQKANLENLNDEQIDMLLDIHFNIDRRDFKELWNYKYMLLKNNHDHFGSINLPSGFRTLDGINYDKNGTYLEEWLKYQYKRYENGKLFDDERLLLEDLGVTFGERER